MRSASITDLTYLDNAATTFPKPDVMHDAVHEFYKNYGVNPGRIPGGRRGRDKGVFQTRALRFYSHTKKVSRRMRAGK
jgi:selenocysteine lyase/cysteine desulfurase